MMILVSKVHQGGMILTLALRHGRFAMNGAGTWGVVVLTHVERVNLTDWIVLIIIVMGHVFIPMGHNVIEEVIVWRRTIVVIVVKLTYFQEQNRFIGFRNKGRNIYKTKELKPRNNQTGAIYLYSFDAEKYADHQDYEMLKDWDSTWLVGFIKY